jgi:4-hydroxy-3-methylbut-2-enyl diphosphate reductase
MKVVVVNKAGFCFGVKRAIEMAFEVARTEKDVFTLGPLIHNPQVINALREAGIQVANGMDDLKKKKARTVIIRTHGITREEMERLGREDLSVIDLTCPFVKKAQRYAKLLSEEGYQVIILGDIEHPEVKGLRSYAGENAAVVKTSEELSQIKPKTGIVVQTTQPAEALRKLVSDIIEHTTELKVYNTICSSTALRLKETEEVARKVDAMLVVGGKNSANTSQLARLCESLSVPTYHIETAGEIRREWAGGVRKMGLTAGASTPDWIIKDVEKALKDMGGCKK